ncbi:uncharacterized protein K444DRAFT_544092, partial [Hyaloscypha bicolor E]
INIKKSEFKIIYIKYLGFIISISSIKVDPNKVKFFLSFYNFYKYFIREYGRITRPLILLIKKSISFK